MGTIAIAEPVLTLREGGQTAVVRGTCTTCGQSVEARNALVASFLREGRPITCDRCRANGRQWTASAYQDYLKSAHWHATRAKAIVRAGNKCQVCAATSGLDVHHNDYSRLGGELPTDMIVLCQECHDVFHTYRALSY